MIVKKGLLIVVSAPAGCGKDTILERVFNDVSDLNYSVSATTRKMRDGETDGISYHFKTRLEFETMLNNNELLEHTEYVGNYYGTLKKTVVDMVNNSKDVVLKIEVEGAGKIKKIFPDCILIFILPPSIDELERRLIKRGTEDKYTIRDRINKAKIELTFAKNYDYTIVNDEIEKAVEDFKSIIKAEKLSVKRGIPKF